MADLTEFQRQAVEMISDQEGIPTALLRYDVEDGPELLMQNGWADENDYAPQLDLLAVYVAHLAQRAGMSTQAIYEEVDERHESWNTEGVGVDHEQRGGE